MIVPDVYRQFLSENINFSNLLGDGKRTNAPLNGSPTKPSTNTGPNSNLIQGIDSSVRSNFDVSSLQREVAGFNSITDFVQWENSVRLIGISLFPINYDNVEFMGIRLEPFDEINLKYDQPFYIILKPSAKAPGIQELYKHNLPKYINIHQYWEFFTRGTDTSDVNVMKFANACYKHLLKVHCRVQFFQKLDKNSQYDNLYSLLQIDSMGLNVSFRLGADIIKIKTDDSNDEIVECSVNDVNNMSLLGSIYSLPNKFDLIHK